MRFATNRRLLAGAIGAALVALMAAPAMAKDAPIDQELEKYWNVELAVPTTENPLFTKKGTFELAVAVGVLPNDSYYLGLPVGVRAGYHLTGSLALEAGFSYVLTSDSDLHTFLKTAGKSGLLQNVKKPPHLYMLTSLDLVYSPFHGKVGIFASKLSSFDIGLLVGAGMIGVDIDDATFGCAPGQGVSLDPNADSAQIESKLVPAGHWGAVLRFYLNEWAAIRWEVRQFGYKPEDAFLFPIEFSVNAAFMLN